MMKMNQLLVMAGVAAMMSLGTSQVVAQPNGGGGRGGPPDPAQFRQGMLDYAKQALEITSDEDWKALQPLVEKVMDANMQARGGFGRGGMFRRNRGGDNAPADQGQQRNAGRPANPDRDALQKAIDSKASKAEMKAAMEKYVAARKVKQAELEKAQEDLRKVLTTRQEAIATINGWL